ncbi:hypothetical protein GCM10011360_18180 [Primorskyibacter flagellatus]|uniref:Uncharacterized protein n=1 Tax=Primorskyibacter flagellatus TaxID=1387277 RepID=A0A917EET6_9RHOB|nr:hypothetical protein GCM10011360_18180 [Primorskyibacter flagellatus]
MQAFGTEEKHRLIGAEAAEIGVCAGQGGVLHVWAFLPVQCPRGCRRIRLGFVCCSTVIAGFAPEISDREIKSDCDGAA